MSPLLTYLTSQISTRGVSCQVVPANSSRAYPYPNTEGPGRSTHAAATHYPAQLLYDQPLDEAKLRAALLSVTAEDGIKADEVALTFMEEKPNDWRCLSGPRDKTSVMPCVT